MSDVCPDSLSVLVLTFVLAFIRLSPAAAVARPFVSFSPGPVKAQKSLVTVCVESLGCGGVSREKGGSVEPGPKARRGLGRGRRGGGGGGGYDHIYLVRVMYWDMKKSVYMDRTEVCMH